MKKPSQITTPTNELSDESLDAVTGGQWIPPPRGQYPQYQPDVDTKSFSKPSVYSGRRFNSVMVKRVAR